MRTWIYERTGCPAPRRRGGVMTRETDQVTAEHYFSTDPDAPMRRREIEFSVGGRNYRLAVAAGVFSAGRLDPGTAVLLRKARLPGPGTEGALLDLGCGYGPITCVLATEAPRATVYAIDVNSRARDL